MDTKTNEEEKCFVLFIASSSQTIPYSVCNTREDAETLVDLCDCDCIVTEVPMPSYVVEASFKLVRGILDNVDNAWKDIITDI